MDNKAIHQPMVTDQNEEQGIHPLSDHMNISVAFKEIVSKDPPRYTKFLEAINKTFEDISDCVGYVINNFYNLFTFYILEL